MIRPERPGGSALCITGRECEAPTLSLRADANAARMDRVGARLGLEHRPDEREPCVPISPWSATRIGNSITYYASFGPLLGPAPFREGAPPIGVFARARRRAGGAGLYPVGIAHPAAWIHYQGTVAATFRLVIGAAELDGRWICDRRVFVRAESVAVSLAERVQ